MSLRLAAVSCLVRDYDEAIAWFTQVLGFDLIEDKPIVEGKRWVRVAPPGGGPALLLARAQGEAQRDTIGRAAGGRVAFFLHTDDFAATHARLTVKGVRFCEAPRVEAYGIVAVFEDLYGNRWDLIEPKR